MLPKPTNFYGKTFICVDDSEAKADIVGLKVNTNVARKKSETTLLHTAFLV